MSVTLQQAARVLGKAGGKARTENNDDAALSRFARKASRTKKERFGGDWAKKVQRGERLVPVTNLPPQAPQEKS